VQRAPQDRLIDLLSELVAIESVNPVFAPGGRGESAVADFIEQHCRRAGLQVTRQPVLPGRDNLLVELSVPGAESTILFESHMDTVSLAPMDERALRPEIREGRLYGRGACDDKGSLAAMIAAFETLAGRRKEIKANLLLLCAVDEEHQFRGVLAFIDRNIRVEGAVVGEPTDLRVVIAHKGVVRWRLSTLGRAAHSSEPHEGDSAIDQMADVLLALRRLQSDLQGRRHPLVGPPTLNVGRITGGIGVNIVPDRCTIELERRIVGDENHAAALAEVDARLAELSAANPRLRIEREEPFVTTPTLATPPESAIVAAAQKACRDVGVSDALAGVSYGSDASKLWTFGKIPSVVLGPGSIRQAHTADEFVPLDELTNAAKIYVQIALNWPGRRAAERSIRETGGI
jgi:acetylornithine deacetylase/succinyl-diaminopimelate desuccinylase-like protein